MRVRREARCHEPSSPRAVHGASRGERIWPRPAVARADQTIMLVKTLGRRQWKQASGYHRQSRVENAFFRYKSIIGDGLRARSPAGQGSEAVLGCEILNRMTAPRPTSVVSHRQLRILSMGIVRASDHSCNNASHRRGERGPDYRPPSSQRGTSSYTWDEPSTSSL